MRSAIALVFVFGCAAPQPPPPATPVEVPLFAISDDAFGPLDGKTPATLAALRRAFAGYEVAPVNAESLEYRVSMDTAKLFDVIPDANGAVLNIHVVTPKLVAGGWRVGDPFRGDVSTCECWGDQIVCFNAGAHVAVALAKICREGTLTSARARAVLAGVAIRATIWSPRPLAAGGV
ncbi:MAG: hypothetical protein M4D80_36570 [Myxococcota bacterium]|nr:hypothetical protein [Deltaproteobacteria bacterium]MDQ3340706.1 hypothetical protein [Myxococcota bacterium]